MSTWLVIVLILIILAIVLWFVFSRGNPKPQPPAPRPARTIRQLEPGDVVSYWTGEDEAVTGAVVAREVVNERATEWRWALVDNGRILEASPDGLWAFGDPEVLYQGTADFEKFVPPHGILATFEERVREGIVGGNPVIVEHRGRRYRVASTGTFGATLMGDAVERPIWRDVSPDASQNVYFEMEALPGQEEAGDREVLGIWTSHLMLLYGVPFDEGAVKGLYTR